MSHSILTTESGGASAPEPAPTDRLPAKAPRSRSRRALHVLLPFLALVLFTLGCSAADLAQRAAQAPQPTRTLAPTFTPTAESVQGVIIVTPPAGTTPGVIIIPPGVDPSSFIVPLPTATPLPTETFTPDPNAPPAPGTPTPIGLGEPGIETPPVSVVVLPTPEPTPTLSPTPSLTPSATPSLTPTPFIVLDAGFTSLRSGPGAEFPLVAQLGPGIPITIVGRNTEGSWYQLCCVNGEAVWVAASSVRTMNDPSGVSLVASGPAPTPTWTPTATWTPTITPTPTSTPYPFQKTIGPNFFPTNNEFLTIWARLFIGTPPLDVPADGYYLTVLFEGFERPQTNVRAASAPEFSFSASPGAGNRIQYNVKYEYTPPDPKTLDPNSTRTRADLIGTGTWTVYVSDGAGKQLSDSVTFTTQPTNPNREIYLAWQRVR